VNIVVRRARMLPLADVMAICLRYAELFRWGTGGGDAWPIGPRREWPDHACFRGGFCFERFSLDRPARSPKVPSAITRYYRLQHDFR